MTIASTAATMNSGTAGVDAAATRGAGGSTLKTTAATANSGSLSIGNSGTTSNALVLALARHFGRADARRLRDSLDLAEPDPRRKLRRRDVITNGLVSDDFIDLTGSAGNANAELNVTGAVQP